QELADGDGAPVEEEGTHAQVGVDAADLRGVQGAVGPRGDGAVVQGGQGHADPEQLGGVDAGGPRLGQGTVTDPPQVRGDLVGQHLLQAQAEEVRGVTAVGTGHHVSADAG